jgi:hypothetical protein
VINQRSHFSQPLCSFVTLTNGVSDGMITVVIFASDSADVDHAPLSVRLHGGATVDAATMAAALQSARLRAKQIVSTLNSLSKR